MTCPECHGEKKTYAAIMPGMGNPLAITCIRCNGIGEIPDHHAEWIRMGHELRFFRTRSIRISLQERAWQLGIDLSTLSQMERGLQDPSPIYQRGLRGNGHL